MLSSAFKLTCPRCRQGDMFEKPIDLKRPLKMHKQCSVCGQRMEPELGFYYGAMFISYVFIAFTSLLIVGTLVFLFKISVEISFAILIGFLALIFIWNLRFARSVWIHIIIKHDRRYKTKRVGDK